MDEALRRAYLAAMDIPVWLPRSEPDPLAVPEPPQARLAASAERGEPSPPPPVVNAPLPSSRPGRGQAMLAGKPTAPPRRVSDAGTAVTVGAMSFSFGIVRQGNTLIIDEQPLSSRAEELARAICFAVERTKAAATSQDFSWPPRGAPFVAAEARDALLARIDKLGGETLGRLLLLGASPASVLLGWDAARWASRPVAAHRIEGLDGDILLLPGLSAMLGDAAEKRVAWEHLRATLSSHG